MSIFVAKGKLLIPDSEAG